MSFVHELRVRYGECDPQGIVFNANYLLYFDVAFTEYWRDRVGPWDEMADLGVAAVVAEANLRFRAPARSDDVLGLEVTTEELGTADVGQDGDARRDQGEAGGAGVVTGAPGSGVPVAVADAFAGASSASA